MNWGPSDQNALAWNIVGFGTVGTLICIFAWGLWARRGFRLAALFVALSGVGFAASGVFPADVSDMNASTTQRHIIASLVSFGAFVVAVPVVGWGLWTSRRRRFALGATAFGIAAVTSVLLRETDMAPGLRSESIFWPICFGSRWQPLPLLGSATTDRPSR